MYVHVYICVYMAKISWECLPSNSTAGVTESENSHTKSSQKARCRSLVLLVVPVGARRRGVQADYVYPSPPRVLNK